MITWWKDPHKESETQDQEGNTQVEFDTSHDEYGLLERVAGPKEGAEIDIVAVHGLGGHASRTWEATDRNGVKTNWISDRVFLQKELPKARIFTFGYPAKVLGDQNVCRIRDHGRNLSAQLSRERRECPDRPILWIGHSLGGIVMKQALITFHEEIKQSLRTGPNAMMFLGTPHHGSDVGGLGSWVETVQTVVFWASDTKKAPLLEELRPFSNTLRDTNQDFSHIAKNFAIRSFWETKETFPLGKLIVNEGSAMTYLPDEIAIGLNANHENLCKFESPYHDNYRIVIAEILDLVKWCKEKRTLLKAPNVSDVRTTQKRAPSALFVGRKSYLDNLSRYFSARSYGQHPRREFLLYGMGGAGKTQLALKFAELNKNRFKAVFWADATNKDTLEQSYKNIASMHMPNPHKNTSLQSALSWFESLDSESLLIFDGADDMNAISGLLPPGIHGNVLYISRNHMARALPSNQVLRVDRLDENEAVDLLLKAAHVEVSLQNKHLAAQIANALDYLALAVDQAGACIRGGQYRIEEYLTAFDKRRKDLMSNNFYHGASTYEQAAYTTWDLSYRAIEIRVEQRADDGAQCALELLNIFAFFHFENIMEDTFRRAAEVDGEIGSDRTLHEDEKIKSLFHLDHNTWDNYSFRRGISTLLSYALINRSPSETNFSVHRLVHSWARDRLSTENQSLYFCIACITLAASIPRDDETDNQIYRSKVLSHVIAFQTRNPKKSLGETILATDSRFGFLLLEAGRSREVEIMNRDVLALNEKVNGKGHPWSLNIMDNLAQALKAQGKGLDAEIVWRDALDLTKNALGPKHRAVMERTNHVAGCLLHQGKVTDAEILYREALQKNKTILGSTDLGTLQNMSNLAEVLLFQGKLAEAERLHQKAADMHVSIFGDFHPATAESKFKLATTLTSRGEHEKAESLHQEIIDRYTPMLPEDSQYNLAAKFEIAETLAHRGKSKKAKAMHQKVLQVREKNLGAEHPGTLKSKSRVAKLAPREEGQKMYREVLQACYATQGEHHPQTLKTLSDLAHSLADQGEDEEAGKLYRQVVSGRIKLSGSRRPETLIAIHDLANSPHCIGTEDAQKETLDLYQEAATGFAETLGPDHVCTLDCTSSLASELSFQHKWEEAEMIYRNLLARKTKDYGPHHPESLQLTDLLVYVLSKQSDPSKLEEAEGLLRDILKYKIDILGPDHQDTARAAWNLADFLDNQDRRDEGEEVGRQLRQLKE